MIDHRARELIQAGMDGELDESAQAELEQILAASPEARVYREQMLAMESFLDRSPRLELPDGLHKSIIDSISLPRSRSRWLSRGFSQFPGFVRYGLAAAAGLLMAVGIYEYRPGMDPAGDLSGMTGTILPGQGSVKDVLLDDVSFELDELSSQVKLLRRGNSVVVDMHIDAVEPVRITLEFTGESLQFDAIAQMESDMDSIEISDRTVRIDARGQQHFAVVFHQDPSKQADARVLMNWASGSKVLKTDSFSIN